MFGNPRKARDKRERESKAQKDRQLMIKYTENDTVVKKKKRELANSERRNGGIRRGCARNGDTIIIIIIVVVNILPGAGSRSSRRLGASAGAVGPRAPLLL